MVILLDLASFIIGWKMALGEGMKTILSNSIKFNNNHVYEDKLNHAHDQQKGNVATCRQMTTVEISINFTYFFLYTYQNFPLISRTASV